MSIGERIAEERKRIGFTQTSFAEKLGVSLSSQKRYETSERVPNIYYIGALEKIGVNIAYVMSGSTDAIEKLKFYTTLDRQTAELLVLILLDMDKEGFVEALAKIEHPVGTTNFLSSALDALIDHSPPLLERLNANKKKKSSTV